MSLAAVLEASRDVVKAVSGITSAYVLLPEKAPPAAVLPCAIQEVVEGDVVWAVSQEHITHRWYLDILTSRAGDMQTETASKIAFIPLVIAAYRTQMALGLGAAGVRNCRPLRYESVQLAIFDATYNAVRFHMQCEEKYGVTLAA
jgi:hypothetical protein